MTSPFIICGVVLASQRIHRQVAWCWIEFLVGPGGSTSVPCVARWSRFVDDDNRSTIGIQAGRDMEVGHSRCPRGQIISISLDWSLGDADNWTCLLKDGIHDLQSWKIFWISKFLKQPKGIVVGLIDCLMACMINSKLTSTSNSIASLPGGLEIICNSPVPMSSI